MKTIHLSFDSISREFVAECEDKEIRSTFTNEENLDIDYFHFTQKCMRVFGRVNNLYLRSSTIDNFVMDSGRFEWTKESLLINRELVETAHSGMIRVSENMKMYLKTASCGRYEILKVENR